MTENQTFSFCPSQRAVKRFLEDGRSHEDLQIKSSCVHLLNVNGREKVPVITFHPGSDCGQSETSLLRLNEENTIIYF